MIFFCKSFSIILVKQVILENKWHASLTDQLADPLLACLGPNDLPTAFPQEHGSRSHVGRIANANLDIAPDRTNHRVQFLALEGGTAEGDTQVVTVDDEAKRALVHVEHYRKLVRNGELVVGPEPTWIGGFFLIVEASRTNDIPAPRFSIGADKGAVS